MAIPFSRTRRALDPSHYRWPMLWLGGALILVGLWGLLFFRAEITRYATSDQVFVTDWEQRTSVFAQRSGASRRAQTFRERLIRADFPSRALGEIHAGQRALLYLEGPAGRQAGAIPAVVSSISPPEHPGGPAQVQLLARAPDDESNPFITGGGGKIKVAVDSTTPAALVFRASGLSTPPHPVEHDEVRVFRDTLPMRME